MNKLADVIRLSDRQKASESTDQKLGGDSFWEGNSKELRQR